MIIFGAYLLISGTGGEQATIQNLWNNGGVFPKGWLSGNSEGGLADYLPQWLLLCSLLEV